MESIVLGHARISREREGLVGPVAAFVRALAFGERCMSLAPGGDGTVSQRGPHAGEVSLSDTTRTWRERLAEALS